MNKSRKNMFYILKRCLILMRSIVQEWKKCKRKTKQNNNTWQKRNKQNRNYKRRAQLRIA